VYSPDPAYWRADASKDSGDPPISSAIFTINPDGSTTIQPVAIPEPSALALMGLGLGLGLARLRARRQRGRYGAAV
jgi:hypothetical protein